MLISISEKRLRIYLHILKQLIMEWMHRQYVVLLMFPKRGTVQQHSNVYRILQIITDVHSGMLCVMHRRFLTSARSLNKIENFVTLILGFKAKQEYMSIQELTESVVRDTGYIEYLSESETKEEVENRQENIDEFINKIVSYEVGDAQNDFDDSVNNTLEPTSVADGRGDVQVADNEHFKPTLSGFCLKLHLLLILIILTSQAISVLMTLHSAKGLEFPIVYMTGLEDGLFPSYMTIVSDDPTDVEEERRLCYVGITRAQKELNISSAKQRMVHGETQMNKVSRFVNEIPKELLNIENRNRL